MPWLINKNPKGQFCVYKKGADGKATGSSLGCHDAQKDAKAQLAALYANVARQAGHTGVMVAFFLAPQDAQALALTAEALPAGAEPLPPDELHLTLAFLGDSTELTVDRETVLAQLQAFASEAGPVSGMVSGIGRFSAPAGEKTPVYASFDSPSIAEWRAELKNDLGAAGAEPNAEHGFTPHITLAYLPADAPMPDIALPQRELTFDTLALDWADDVDLIDLQGTARERESMNPKRTLFQRAIAQFVATLEDAFGLTEPAPAPADPPAAVPVEAAPVARAVSDTQLIDQVIEQAATLYPDALLLDVYYDTGGVMYAILTDGGKLYRCDLTIAGTAVTVGAWREVAAQFGDTGGAAPAPGAGAPADPNAAPAAPVANSRMAIIRQEDGRVRWLSVSCTAVLNRSGEIDSRELFDSFEANFAANPKPLRVFYHAGGAFRIGECDLVARDGFTLVTSGLYDDTDIARAEIAAREAQPDYWGDSIGYDPTSAPEMLEVGEGVSIPVYNAGVLREISTLPEAHAAALFTRTIPQEVTRMLNDRQFKAFVALCGGDEAKAQAMYDAINPDETNRAIDAGGLLARAASPAPVAPVAPVVTEAATPVPAPAPADTAAPVDLTDSAGDTLTLDDAAIAAITAQVLAAPAIVTLISQMQALTDASAQTGRDTSARNQRYENSLAEIDRRLGGVEAGHDERLATALEDLPQRRQIHVTHRPRLQVDPAAEAAPTLADTANATLATLH